MRLTSPEFENNSHIPGKFTGLGDDINPELIIEDIPPEANSLALIVDDPNAPMGIWIQAYRYKGKNLYSINNF